MRLTQLGGVLKKYMKIKLKMVLLANFQSSEAITDGNMKVRENEYFPQK